jgi:hypothetical protein
MYLHLLVTACLIRYLPWINTAGAGLLSNLCDHYFAFTFEGKQRDFCCGTIWSFPQCSLVKLNRPFIEKGEIWHALEQEWLLTYDYVMASKKTVRRKLLQHIYILEHREKIKFLRQLLTSWKRASFLIFNVDTYRGTKFFLYLRINRSILLVYVPSLNGQDVRVFRYLH